MTLFVVVPPALVALISYVTELVRFDIVRLPLNAVSPKFDVKLVAPLVLQVKVVDPLYAIEVDEALKDAVGADGGLTVIVTELVTVPPGPVAVKVYVVVVVGVTEVEPSTLTPPIP